MFCSLEKKNFTSPTILIIEMMFQCLLVNRSLELVGNPCLDKKSNPNTVYFLKEKVAIHQLGLPLIDR